MCDCMVYDCEHNTAGRCVIKHTIDKFARCISLKNKKKKVMNYGKKE